MKRTLTFDDVLIQPQFSTISSRKECDTTTKLGNLSLPLGIISSNMDTVTNEVMSTAMKEAGGLGALHRFCTIEENVAMYLKSPQETFVSIGVGEKELERAQALINIGARNFIIDVANGASSIVVQQYKNLRRILGHFDCHVMVGNFATKESIFQFREALKGSQIPDSYKIGVGGGSLCTTRIVTGCGLPTLASVLDCASLRFNGEKIALVADGGIRNSGDIAKALAAGAIAVMVGGILSGTDETPGEIIPGDRYTQVEPLFKKYRGSASKESYEVQGKTASHRTAEGESTLVPYKGPVAPILEQLKAGLQSSMSYVNARTMEEFRENAELVEITNAGIRENSAHGKN